MAEPADTGIWVLAGTNGAGKSSIGGEILRREDLNYLNPDEWTRKLREANPKLSEDEANGMAWVENRQRLEAAIASRSNYAFETTLGGHTIAALLHKACDAGIAVRIWYCALASVELHIQRVKARVERGGHNIPVEKIRKRYDDSRANLVELVPKLAELYVYDNSVEAPPGGAPAPTLILRMQNRKIVKVAPVEAVPDWAKAIVMTGMKTDAGKGQV